MARFVAFDVETPNRWNDRMSAIGITVLEDGEIVEEFYSLVDPEVHFDAFNVELTGISEESVWNAPNFAELWPQIEPLLHYLEDGAEVRNYIRTYSFEKKGYT